VARVLVDTDVLAAHLRGDRRYDPGQDEVHVSAISRTELAAGRGTDEAVVARLIDAMKSIDVDKAIADRAGQIQRQGGLSIAAALVAATAMEHELTLVTADLFAYRGIGGLHAASPS
jgi:predicted nucleic acid-binding protein